MSLTPWRPRPLVRALHNESSPIVSWHIGFATIRVMKALAALMSKPLLVESESTRVS